MSKANSTDAIPSSRLSRSMLSVASSREKSVDVGSCGFVHQSRGLPYRGEWLPPEVRIRDDSPLVLSATTTTSEDPSAVLPFVRTTSTADGVDWAASSDTAMAAANCA